ncbi:dynamin family protein [Thiolinea disciformis]|uniref:dynamin family protein n=1 Tax=Thiolinea disciformis TaxID=125614 RepID=UPI00036C2A53|nr:dynamin family protein [Thiolinea disciformis]
MSITPAKRMDQRLKRLQEHLKRENPALVDVVDKYRQLDSVAIKLGLLQQGESYSTRISWWPLISILGTFSAGKSSFINTYLGVDLQRTGNQAVDDRFTVITYSPDGQQQTLPGLALDGDPRFPFYQISEEIENVAPGEGSKIDNYLQMKVVPSEQVRGKILIDSPGFDADAQRRAILRITDHIIDISDLVLVFFDARHPEPGAMQDTLEHLVRGAQRRNDSSKFLFILNQIDTSAREDNLEDIVASWQKALIQYGLSAGSFFVLFNDKVAVPVQDEKVWARYVAKRNADYERILTRMDSVNTDRVYRIIGTMESITNQIEQQAMPNLQNLLARWRRNTLIWDAIAFGTLGVLALILSVSLGFWQGGSFTPPWTDLWGSPLLAAAVIGIPLILALLLHFFIRNKVAKRLSKPLSENEVYGSLLSAFRKSTGTWRSIIQTTPSGWSSRTRRHLDAIRDAADHLIQRMNDRFTNPSAGQASPKK